MGHAWVKRLFVDKEYRETENPDDYCFIPANVYDNTVLIEKMPEYVKALEALPEDQKKADLYGSWDVYEGQYFTEWDRSLHVVKPFPISPSWRIYYAMDYGLDMFAAQWYAVDEQGRSFCFREFCQSNMIASEAAEKVKEIEANDDFSVFMRCAPPDLWNRRNDTGKSVADIFAEHQVYLSRVSNDRVQGWYTMKEMLHPFTDEFGANNARLRFFENCTQTIKHIPLAQYDDKNANDVATEPHSITHTNDAVRYFCCGNPLAASTVENKKHNYGDSAFYETESLLNYGMS